MRPSDPTFGLWNPWHRPSEAGGNVRASAMLPPAASQENNIIRILCYLITGEKSGKFHITIPAKITMTV